MLNAVIIEDERLAIDKLRSILTELVPDIHFAAIITSVKEGISYFAEMPKQDIIFCDIHLTDGLSFEIFNNFQVDTPLIFTTAYDEFIMKAFDYNSIDYLLKPVNVQEVSKAVQKYKLLQQHFNQNAQKLSTLLDYFEAPKKMRLIVKRGIEHIAVKLDEIVLFYTENKVVYLIDKQRTKYIYDKNLSISENELDTCLFFSPNLEAFRRKYIHLSVRVIKS